ncbi:MAG TPA: UvrD-helicase domain-containing protein, partial [Holophaga sp.]|nr:UvrD-helicase domain-containing protein [Holophaga sp.]
MTRLRKPPILAALKPGHDVIEASAGTGKTYTLERLVADQVIRGTALERILVVTFTEKAALELKTRIRTFLRSLQDEEGDASGAPDAWVLDLEARERLGTALRSFERATIATIHGFCRQVLQESALEGGTLFDLELVDERKLFGAAFHHCVATRFAVDPEACGMLREAVASGMSMTSLEDLLWSAHNDGGELHPRPGDWRRAREGFQAAWAAQPEEIVQGWQQAKVHHKTISTAESQLAALCASLQEAQPDFAWALQLQDLGRTSLVKASEKNGLEGAAKAFADWFLAFHRAAPTVEAVLAHAFLGPVREEMDRRCREEGLFTFSRMVHGVVEALRDEALAERLARRFDLVLVDEFQDTDPCQWEIFRRVFAASGRMILIGDPKQAIY